MPTYSKSSKVYTTLGVNDLVPSSSHGVVFLLFQTVFNINDNDSEKEPKMTRIEFLNAMKKAPKISLQWVWKCNN